ncbi:MAG: hypothetical protein SFV15_04855 [Polyangiaceae bacterium]|nr:hypothetical protein [Polyangiaceae bacterium]
MCVQNRGGTDPNRTLRFCSDTSECLGDEGCYPWGICAQDATAACLGPGTDGGAGCGACQAPVLGSCQNKAICTQAEYSTPAVGISPLPGNLAPALSSLTATNPLAPGAPQETNSGVALSAALEHAQAFASQSPSHTVAVVLVTDGLPNFCFPFDIVTGQDVSRAVQAVAQTAATGYQSAAKIRTFVIGVLDAPDPADPGAVDATPLMDAIAQSGGTGKAFVLNAAGDVGSGFSQALQAIRGSALSCDYQVPAPPANEQLDYFKVNVQFTAQGAPPSTLLYVPGPDKCDPNLGGWFYDVNPAAGGKPTKISVCPQNCSMFQSAQNAQVDVQLGCVTQVAILR